MDIKLSMNKILIITALFFILVNSCFAKFIQDDLVLKTLIDKNFCAPKTHLKYNYESTLTIPIKLSITKSIESQDDIQENQTVYFKVNNNVIVDNKIIVKKGTIIPAKIQYIITPGMNGICGSIIFSDFKIDGISSGQITSSYEVYGQDRSLWVFPLKWLLTPVPPIGSLTNLIIGGNAKLTCEKIITIYYHPEWI